MDWWASVSSSAAPCANGAANSAAAADQMNQMDVGAIFDPWLNCDDLDLGTILHQTTSGNTNHITTSLSSCQAGGGGGFNQGQQQQQGAAPGAASGQPSSHNQAPPFSAASSSSSSPTISSSNLHSATPIAAASPTAHRDQQTGPHITFNQGKFSIASDILNNLTSGRPAAGCFKRATAAFALSSPSQHQHHQRPASEQRADDQLRPLRHSSGANHLLLQHHPLQQQQQHHGQPLARSLHCSSTSTAASPISSIDSSPANNSNSNNLAASSYLQSPTSLSSGSPPSIIVSTARSPVGKPQLGGQQAATKPTTILQHLNHASQPHPQLNHQSFADYCQSADNSDQQHLYEQQLLQQHQHQFEVRLDSKSELENLVRAGNAESQLATFTESPSEPHAFSRQQTGAQVITEGASLLEHNNNNSNNTSASANSNSNELSTSHSRAPPKSSRPAANSTVVRVSSSSSRASSAKQQPTSASARPASQRGQKIRRCRHITDYVLADEEKRLLIKEGHADFPMICQSRPLSKTEERVLRKIRRKIRNKKSAQCSRQRKKEYVEELERKYAAVIRENEELKRIIDRIQEAQQQQQHQQQQQQQQQQQHDQQQLQQIQMQMPQQQQQLAPSGRHLQQHLNHLEHHQPHTDLGEPVELDWKDLFSSSIKVVQQSNVYGD